MKIVSEGSQKRAKGGTFTGTLHPKLPDYRKPGIFWAGSALMPHATFAWEHSGIKPIPEEWALS